MSTEDKPRRPMFLSEKLERLRWFYASHWNVSEDTIEIEIHSSNRCFNVSVKGFTSPEYYDYLEESEKGFLTSHHQGEIVDQVVKHLFIANIPKLLSTLYAKASITAAWDEASC